ncbi:MAG: calcium-binding protein [Cyanobacteriota bacterium]
MATIYGTTGNDNGIDNSIIYGIQEDDDIFALEGNDIVYAGAGNDYVDGWTGDDTLYGGTTSDPNEIGTGNDVLVAWYGDDNLYGQDGDDWLDGSYDDDRLYGGEGNDILGNAYLQGEPGNDIMYGGKGNDQLYGGSGEDVLVGGQRGNHIEIDVLTGGSEADKFLLGDYHGNLYSVAGNNDYARITDFKKGQDSVHLDQGNYTLGASPISGISGTAIYAGTELIGILEGVDQSNLHFTNNYYTTSLT